MYKNLKYTISYIIPCIYQYTHILGQLQQSSGTVLTILQVQAYAPAILSNRTFSLPENILVVYPVLNVHIGAYQYIYLTVYILHVQVICNQCHDY